jgi:4a-hydroxytetrahydrobiopterin dehydratase
MNNTTLSSKKCTPCQGGIAPMTIELAQTHLQDVHGWDLLDKALKLKRTFIFNNFEDAMQFAQHVGQLCEDEGHHADLGIGWGYCRVEFQTHKINGLHESDFIMAAKVNGLAESNGKILSK